MLEFETLVEGYKVQFLVFFHFSYPSALQAIPFLGKNSNINKVYVVRVQLFKSLIAVDS
jgi:hypothetical protein